MSTSHAIAEKLSSEVGSFQGSVNSAVQKIEGSINEIKASTQKIYQRMEQFKTTMLEGEEKSIALENILKIDQKINEQLSYYLTIRRTIAGIVKDLDFNLVRKSTIAELSEELWMSSSKYWLSYALIAINAWIQGDKEIAANAIGETLRKDKIKGSLFFCLINLRFARHDAAKKWLFEYFNAVDPINPPAESALLLQAFLMGVFGSDAIIESAVRETIDGWVNEIKANEAISTELASLYLAWMGTLPARALTEYDVLSEHCANYDQLRGSLLGASRFVMMLNMINSLDNVELANVERDFIEDVDAVLMDLISNYDDEEMRLRNEQKYYQLIVDNNGDVAAAKAQFEALEGTGGGSVPNIGRQMAGWALNPTKGIAKEVTKFAVQKTKTWYSEAVDKYATIIKGGRPKEFKLKIDLWENSVDGNNVEEAKRSLENTFQSKKRALVIFRKSNVVLTILAILFGIVSTLLGVFWQPIAYCGLGLTALLLLIVLIKVLVGIKKFPTRIKSATDTLYKCFDQIQKFGNDLTRLYGVAEQVKEKLYYL